MSVFLIAAATLAEAGRPAERIAAAVHGQVERIDQVSVEFVTDPSP